MFTFIMGPRACINGMQHSINELFTTNMIHIANNINMRVYLFQKLIKN